MQLHPFFTSALVEGEWLNGYPDHFTTQWVWHWVGPRAGLDVLKKSKFYCPYSNFNLWIIQPIALTLQERAKSSPHSYHASWCYQSFIYSPTDALVSCLKGSIKIYIKIAPTCFGVTVTPSSRSALICAGVAACTCSHTTTVLTTYLRILIDYL